MRQFDSGAIRDDDEGKLDYEGCLSPMVLERYAQYMMKHCTQRDGKKRTSDNWRKGFPKSSYMKSAKRHLHKAWAIHREEEQGDIQESLCALLFNAMGYLFEELKPAPTGYHTPVVGALSDKQRRANVKHPTGHTPELGHAE